MPEHVATFRFANQAEADRCRRLMSEDEQGLGWVQTGAKLAHDFVPGIKAGIYGITEHDMDVGLQRHLRACYGSPRRDGALALDADQRFLLRLGFEAVALPAKEEALAAVAAGAALVQPTVDFLLGVTAYADAVTELSNTLTAALAKPAPHALEMQPPARRPLRPEDFGCLPQGPRI